MKPKFKIIQNILFPGEVCEVSELYYRSESQNCIFSDGRFQFSGQVSFDTYFNALPVGKYMENCLPSDFSFCLRASGSFILRLYSVRQNEDGFLREKLAEFEVDSSEITKTRFTISAQSVAQAGLLYFTVEGRGEMISGYFGMENQSETPVNLGIVICTYKREKFLLKNLEILNHYFQKEKIFDENTLHIYIVDNGRTLKREEIENEFVSLVPNRNTGGSGGFSRGLYEVSHSERNFTHILLMDDDISFECEVLYRLYIFLSFMKSDSKRTAMAGTMLNMSDMFTQHEAGAVWNGRQIFGIGAGMDMRRHKNVYQTAYLPKGNYGGWWFYCFPACWVEEYGYPLQFFVKIDDIEYSLRCAENIIVMNGMAVWHDDFEGKYDGYQEYYIKRNELILASVNSQKPYPFFQIRKLIVNIIKQVVFQRYFLADLVLRAYEDYLKGWEAFFHTEPETFNQELMNLCPKMKNEEELKQEYGVYFDEEKYQESLEIKENLFRQALTWNGYLIPEVFNYDKDDFVIADLARCRAVNFYRHKRVLHYDKKTQKGYVTEQSKKELFRLMGRTISVSFRFLANYKKVRSGYAQNLKLLAKYPKRF